MAKNKKSASRSRERQQKQPAKTGSSLQAIQLKLADLKVDPQSIKAPVWIDRMELLTRAEVSVATVRLLAVIPPDAHQPGTQLEVARLQTSIPHLMQMADLICRQLNHYPTPESVAKSLS